MLYLFECFSVYCIRPIAESNDCCVLRTAATEAPPSRLQLQVETSQVLCISEVSFRNVLNLDPRISITSADKIPCVIISHKSERIAKKSRRCRPEPCNFIQDRNVAVYPYIFHSVCITSATFTKCHNTKTTVSKSLPTFPIFYRGPTENTQIYCENSPSLRSVTLCTGAASRL